MSTTASFTVGASGTTPFSYQWRRNSTNLVNAGNVSGVATTNLILSSVSFSDAASYTVVVSNSAGAVTSSVAVLTVTCPAINVSPASLPNGMAGTAYNQTNTASGGSSPYAFAIITGSLPVGLNLNTNNGAITGTPTETGTNTFTVAATDANGCAGSTNYTVSIACPAITVGPASLPGGTVNTAYSQTNTASGGVGATTFTITSGALPAGLNLNTNNGAIGGTPTTPGTNTFTVTATDTNGCTGSANYTVVIASPIITVAPITLATPGMGTNGDFQFTLTAGANTGVGIQASTNLSDWTLIGTGVTDTNGSLFFDDTNTPNFPDRFYRALSPIPQP